MILNMLKFGLQAVNPDTGERTERAGRKDSQGEHRERATGNGSPAEIEGQTFWH